VADPNEIEQVVRTRLRSLRNTLGLSLDELAERTSLSPSTISRVETGKRTISLDVLLPLATALQIDLDTLRYQGAAATDVTPLFEDLGFQRLAQRIQLGRKLQTHLELRQQLHRREKANPFTRGIHRVHAKAAVVEAEDRFTAQIEASIGAAASHASGRRSLPLEEIRHRGGNHH
jgi:transcriptional regulator with XRE-family HTH domain